MRRFSFHPTGIWRSPTFLRLWSASAISAGGDQVTKLALPIIAIDRLDAGAFAVGLLLTVEQLPQLLLTLIAGAWVDRLRKRSVLLACDLGRAAVLLLVPIAAWADFLTMPLLFAVGFVAGCFATWHMIAWQSMLPLVVGSDELVPAASAIGQIEAISEIGGPVAGGGLVQAVGAPAAVLLDAVSFAGSAALINQLPQNEELAGEKRPPLIGQIGQGVRYILHDPVLRAIGLSGAAAVFFYATRDPLLRVFLLDEKGLSPGRFGLIYSVASVGYATGMFLPNRMARRFGLGNAIFWSLPVFGLATLGLAIAVSLDYRPALLIAVMLFFENLFEPTNNVNQLSLRLTLMPRDMRGRLTSVVRFLIRGAYPLGALAGGFLGEKLGTQTAIWLSVLGPPVAMLAFWRSGILRFRKLPELMGEE
jgi:MFS family permease